MEVDNRLKSREKKTIWWWQLKCNDEWTHESASKFSSEVNARSIQETEDSSICIGSWMVCVRLY